MSLKLIYALIFLGLFSQTQAGELIPVVAEAVSKPKSDVSLNCLNFPSDIEYYTYSYLEGKDIINLLSTKKQPYSIEEILEFLIKRYSADYEIAVQTLRSIKKKAWKLADIVQRKIPLSFVNETYVTMCRKASEKAKSSETITLSGPLFMIPPYFERNMIKAKECNFDLHSGEPQKIIITINEVDFLIKQSLAPFFIHKSRYVDMREPKETIPEFYEAPLLETLTIQINADKLKEKIPYIFSRILRLDLKSIDLDIYGYDGYSVSKAKELQATEIFNIIKEFVSKMLDTNGYKILDRIKFKIYVRYRNDREKLFRSTMQELAKIMNSVFAHLPYELSHWEDMDIHYDYPVTDGFGFRIRPLKNL